MQSQIEGGLRYLHENEAEGLVASIFSDVRRRLPFVPAVLKALATWPDALLESWVQIRALIDEPRSAGAVRRLRAAVDTGLPYRPSAEVRGAVRPFDEELPTLLLAVASLGLSLDGVLPQQPLPPLALPPPAPVPEPEVPERGEHALFDEIRRAYGTEHVPSLFRSLAARELLEEPWEAIGPYLASETGRARAATLRSAAEGEALAFPQVSFLRTEAARPVLDQFRRALPLTMLFAAACMRTQRGAGGGDYRSPVDLREIARAQRRRQALEELEFERGREGALREQLEDTVTELEGPSVDVEVLARMEPEDAEIVRHTLLEVESEAFEEELGEEWLSDPGDGEEIDREERLAEVARLEAEVAKSRRRQEALEHYLEALSQV
jgi:hypothetical protein